MNLTRTLAIGLCLLGSVAMTPVVSANNLQAEREARHRAQSEHRHDASGEEGGPDTAQVPAPLPADQPTSSARAVPEPGELHSRIGCGLPEIRHAKPITLNILATSTSPPDSDVDCMPLIVTFASPAAFTAHPTAWPHGPPAHN